MSEGKTDREVIFFRLGPLVVGAHKRSEPAWPAIDCKPFVDALLDPFVPLVDWLDRRIRQLGWFNSSDTL